jgi:hypothetical protein
MRIAIKDFGAHDCALLAQEVELPEQARYAVGHIEYHWRNKVTDLTSPLTFSYKPASQGHGPSSPGLIFCPQLSIHSDYDPSSGKLSAGPEKVVATRVSWGFDRPFEERHKFLIWDPKTFNRFHINVSGSRQFFAPDHIEEILRKHGKKPSCLDYEQDNILFSLRWENGKFDDWHDGEHCYHEDRTTFASFTGYSDGGIHVGEEKVAEAIRRAGTERSLVRHVQTKVREPYSNGNYCPEMAVIGYRDVLRLLSPFGHVSEADADKIPKMDYKEGTDYLFGKVLLAIENFILTRH